MYAVAHILSVDGLSGIPPAAEPVDSLTSMIQDTGISKGSPSNYLRSLMNQNSRPVNMEVGTMLEHMLQDMGPPVRPCERRGPPVRPSERWGPPFRPSERWGYNKRRRGSWSK